MNASDKPTKEVGLGYQEELSRHFGTNETDQDTVDERSFGKILSRLNENICEIYDFTPALTAAFVEQAAERILKEEPPTSFDQICTEEGKKLEIANNRLKGNNPEIVKICLKLIKGLFKLNIDNIISLMPEATKIFHENREKKSGTELENLLKKYRETIRETIKSKQKDTDYICHEDELLLAQAIISGLNTDEINIRKAEDAAKMAREKAKSHQINDQQEIIRMGIQIYMQYIERGDLPKGEITVMHRRKKRSAEISGPTHVGESPLRKSGAKETSYEETVRTKPGIDAPKSQILRRADHKKATAYRAKKAENSKKRSTHENHGQKTNEKTIEPPKRNPGTGIVEIKLGAKFPQGDCPENISEMLHDMLKGIKGI